MIQVFMESAPTLTEATAKFVVISNVLGGIRHYDLGGWFGPAPHQKAAAELMRRGKALGTPRVLDKEVRRLLCIAWQTELAARVSDAYDDDMLRRVAAQTLPVQAYYAVFNAARAMTTSAGLSCGTHQAIHRDFESQRVKHAYRSWGTTLSGDPEKLTDCVLAPKITTPKAFNPMELSHEPEDYVWTALRMTRRWKIASARDTWLRANKTKDGKPRMRMPSGERAKLVASVRRTTLMDFLYELRRRANYEGVDQYGSDAEDAVVDRFHRALLHLADMGLLHYEAKLVQYVGVRAYEHEVRGWAASATKVGPWATEAVQRRLEAIKKP